jgi:hypothetical protein
VAANPAASATKVLDVETQEAFAYRVGAVRTNASVWLPAWFGLHRRAPSDAQRPSLHVLSAPLGSAVASPASTARAVASVSVGLGLPRSRPR